MSAASYGGIKAWIWKKVSGFDYDKYWKMREYVINSRGGGSGRGRFKLWKENWGGGTLRLGGPNLV